MIYLWLAGPVWLGSFLACLFLGSARKCLGTAAILGLFLGPIGVLICFGLGFDGRSKCPHCAELYSPGARICPHCRTALAENDRGASIYAGGNDDWGNLREAESSSAVSAEDLEAIANAELNVKKPRKPREIR